MKTPILWKNFLPHPVRGWAGGLLLAVGLWPGHAPAAALQKKALIIGIDGVQPQALAVARTPNLDALKADGAFSDVAVTDPVTHSAACWSSMFCGVWGDKHGVQDPGNNMSSNRFNEYPSFFRRLETANSNLSTVGFARWAPATNIMLGADVRLAFGSDAGITTATCQQLTNANPDVFFTILLGVDDAGHAYGWGPAVTNYVRAIETADGFVGSIMGALTNRATYAQEDWLVVVLSDHGQHDSTVQASRLTFHLLRGPSVAKGVLYPSPSIVDVCATVLTHMGLAIQPEWNLDARLEGLPRARPAYGTNLMFNGDAEWNSGTNNYTPDRGIAWWFDVTGITLGQYGANANFPDFASAGPANRGRYFFLGGTNLNSSIGQTIDLSELGADIDDPGVDYDLSGWFGGRTTQADSARLTARFLDRLGVGLATNNIGGVTAAERGNTTGLLSRSTNGPVPPGTRLVEFTLAANAPSGMNDASADHLSFVLTPRADPPLQMCTPRREAGGWQFEFSSRNNRHYALERSADLQNWTGLVSADGITNAWITLADPNPPLAWAFYRVKVQRR